MPLPGANPPVVAMMCGLPGSGKTVLARQLERDLDALRFDVDEWMIALYGHHMPREQLHQRLGTVKDLLWQAAERAVQLGNAVVLDFGFWKRAERLEFKRRAEAAGAEPVVYFLDAPLPLLRERLAERNRRLPDSTYEVTNEMLEIFAGWFETPGGDEGLRIVHL